MEKGMVRYLPPTNLFFLLEVLRQLPIFVKIDQQCDRESAHRRTHRLTDTLTDANRFYNLSHAICYSYGADNEADCGKAGEDRIYSFGDISNVKFWRFSMTLPIQVVISAAHAQNQRNLLSG